MNRTIKYKRHLVNEYLKNCDTRPLIFPDWYTKRSLYFNAETKTVEQMIEKVLELNESEETDGGDYTDFTNSSSNRSALDIWRLIYNFCPQITIFQVMMGLYKLRSKFNIQMCRKIKKRVFYNPRVRMYWESNINPFIHHTNEKDEFGLTFNEWENL